MKPTRISDFKITSNAAQAAGSEPSEAPFSENYFAQDRVELNVGADAEGFQIARMTRLNIKDETDIGVADFIANCVQIWSDKEYQGTVGGIYASNSAIWLQSGASYKIVVGYNPQFIAEAGSSISSRIGLRLQVGGEVSGSELDAAISAHSHGTAPWRNFIVLNEPESNADGIAEDGNFCSAPQATTIANVFDCPNVTVTDYILNFPNFKVTGNGDVITNGSIVGGGGNYTSANVDLANEITLTNVTAATLNYIDLAAGDWDVSWQSCFRPTGNCTLHQVASSASLSQNTIESAHDKCQVMHWGSAGVTLSSGNAIRSGLGNARFISDDPMRVYLNGLFQAPTGSGCKFSGKIWARRLG